MPIGFSSPSRNLFLLGSSGAQVVTNFFKTIDQSAGTDGVYLPDEIKYNEVDQKFVLAGSAEDSNSKGFGWFEKRDDAGTADFENRIESTQSGVNTTLRALHLTENNRLVVVGKTGTVPWIATYTNGGSLNWQATTNSADVEYTGVTSKLDSVTNLENYYACGNTAVAGEAQAFVEKFDASGNPGWGKSAFMLGRDVVLNKIAANDRGEVVAVGYLEDNVYNKGYIVKIDTNTGEVLWDRTLTPDWQGDMLNCTDVYIDSNDQIYVTVNGNFVGYLLKYTAEGNMIWQKVSNDSAASTITFDQVKSDGETEQTIVFGTYTDPNTNDVGGILSKYSKNGNLVWRRTLFSSYNNYDTFANVSLDADPSFYYLLYTDGPVDGLNGTPDAYTFGKVSSSGNGLGNFQYAEGTGETIDYEILSVGDTIGRLSDGSVRNDTSDNLVYPFNGTKVLFDDLATQVSNKKRQMDDADSFEYSGSPAVRVADFTEVDLGDESFDVTVPADEAVYEEAGTYTFTVPAGVTEVSAVAVGSGGGAASSPGANAPSGGGGGGGGLAYGTFTVTPGEDLTIVVGNFGVGGASGTTAGTAGESTTISRGATVLLEGGGGAGGQADAPTGNSTFGATASGGSSSGTERDGGGSGGNGGPSRGNFGGGGGGGAGGYTGNGGNGGSGNTDSGTGGSGGGGGGGGGQSAGGTQNNGGGGVGLFGGPINGAGGTNGNPGSGGSNGQGGQPGGKGGKFGGGGGGAEDDTNAPGADGGIGGARIIWGAGRSFPNSAAQDFSSVETRVRDKSGKGNNGVVNGATLNAAGYWEFDGVDDYISLGTSNFLTGVSDFTLEMWLYPDNLTIGNYYSFFSYGGFVPGGWVFQRKGDGTNSFRFAFNGTNFYDTATEFSTTGEWKHIVISVSGGVPQNVYVDSVSQSIGGSGTLSITTDQIVEIGRRRDTVNQYFDGRIGEVRIYPRALTAAQVFQNYNATKSKYIEEAPDVAPKITSDGIVIDSNLVLNYDFGNRATYDRVENLLPWSEDFTKWNQSVHFWENNYAIAPDGTKTAALLKESIPSQQQLSYFNIATMPNVTISSGDTLTFTVFAKANTHDVLEMHMYGDAQANFNLTTGVTTSNGASMSAVGDGWYFCKWTRTKSNTNGAVYLGFSGATYAGVGVDKSLFIWHPQVERGYEYGRYIKTSGLSINAPTTVKNLSSNFYPNTINGATFDSAGYFDFDGTNDNIFSGSPETIVYSGGTFEAWLYFDDVSNNRGFMSHSAGGAGPYINFYSPGASQQKMRWEVIANTGNAYTTILSNTNLVTGQWYHFVGTFDGASTITLYVNGTLDIQNPNMSNQPTTVTAAIELAEYAGYMDGRIGETRIYNRELTATEVSQNFNATRGKYGV